MSSPSNNSGSSLHFIDGTTSPKSYVALARRGNIFLGIKFCALADCSGLGAPGKCYLQFRLRSAHGPALAAQLDQEPEAPNVVVFSSLNLGVDEAWPGFTFENVDEVRASVRVGMFIDGSIAKNPGAIVARIQAAGLFQKVVDFVIAQAGPEYSIARAKAAATWLAEQAKPTLDSLQMAAQHKKTILKAQKDFLKSIEGQLEAVGPHLQQLKAIYEKHAQSLSEGDATST